MSHSVLNPKVIKINRILVELTQFWINTDDLRVIIFYSIFPKQESKKWHSSVLLFRRVKYSFFPSREPSAIRHEV